jgi:hypothetical protein
MEPRCVDDAGIEELDDAISSPPEMLTTHHFVPDDDEDA